MNFIDPNGLWTWSDTRETTKILGIGVGVGTSFLLGLSVISLGTAVPIIIGAAAVVGAVKIYEATQLGKPIDKAQVSIEKIKEVESRNWAEYDAAVNLQTCEE